MQLDRAVPNGRRRLWLPALVLTGAALAGCSSGGGGGSSAAPSPAGTAATGAATTTGGASTPAAAPTSSAPTAAATPAATGAASPGTAADRPADACKLLSSPQVIASVGTGGPFTGTHLDPASDGSAVWGCTWGSRQSYAAIHEVQPSVVAAAKADPERRTTPVPGVGSEAILAQRADGTHPMVYFLAGGRAYSVEVRKDRGPDDGVNAPAEALAESALAMVLAKSLTG
ncbi:hypothetical protein OH807_04755 [Kitasatospora sp. NBC_01560]|uniref:hypothetical protein n=1 Tax=Kitasatospora sp. NBC_01560 TaxID=2975965 RepID=UPI0038644C5D